MSEHDLRDIQGLMDWLATLLELKRDEMHADSLLKDDLGCDSLAALEIAYALREEGIFLPDDVLGTTATIEDLRQQIVAASAAGPRE